MRAPEILVVEDDESIRDLLSDILSRAGYRVRLSVDGDVALGSLRQKAPDLVLLDVMMPRSFGLDVLRTIRTSTWGADLPVVVMTAGARPDRIVETFRAGASDYVLKPFTASALLDAVAKLLRGERYDAGPAA